METVARENGAALGRALHSPLNVAGVDARASDGGRESDVLPSRNGGCGRGNRNASDRGCSRRERDGLLERADGENHPVVQQLVGIRALRVVDVVRPAVIGVNLEELRSEYDDGRCVDNLLLFGSELREAVIVLENQRETLLVEVRERSISVTLPTNCA